MMFEKLKYKMTHQDSNGIIRMELSERITDIPKFKEKIKYVDGYDGLMDYSNYVIVFKRCLWRDPEKVAFDVATVIEIELKKIYAQITEK